jgi:hypothetical protein
MEAKEEAPKDTVADANAEEWPHTATMTLIDVML